MTQAASVGNVMVVDDQPANLKLLEVMLRQRGYQVRCFPRGRLALAAAAQNPPELILLDINMPEMDGYEVCGRLKSNQKLAGIPVIFLSALDETGDKIKAFQCGGADYVSKPFQLEEVQARVEVHLALHHAQRSLQQHNEHLEEVVDMRTRELAEAHARLQILDRTKSDFLKLISHELRTPLNGLFGIGELVLDELRFNPQGEQLGAMFEESRLRILDILDHALLLTQIEIEGDRFTPAAIPLTSILALSVERATAFAEAHQVKLESAHTGLGCIQGQTDLMVTAFHALLETAVKFSGVGNAVRVVCQPTDDSIQVTIDGHGRTIPAECIPRFFDLFAIGDAITVNSDLGLGPPVAHRILALFGGSVRVENQASSGIRLTVCLKCA